MNRFVLALWTGFTLFAGVATAQEETPASGLLSSANARNVIAKFPVARQGDLLVIPVAIGESEYPFMLDTGAFATVLSASLAEKLGPLKRSTRSYPKGVPPMYQLPDATLAGTNLSVAGDVAKIDLEPLRHMSGYDIQGMLGMNFLKGHVIEFDFDAGSVTFLESAPKNNAKAFPLDRDVLGRRTVRIEVVPGKSSSFLIDTGMASPGIGEMTSSLFDELLDAERLNVLGPLAKTLTVGGVVSNRKAQLDVFKVGDFEHRNMRVSDGTLNGLGLFYLARYKVTLDFVNDQAFFEPGKRFSAPPEFDASGMIISRFKGKTLVDRVHPDGPAYAAEVRTGDVLTHLNGHPVNDYSLFVIRQALAQPERTLKLSFERSGEKHEYQMTLRNWQKAVLEP